MWISLETSLNQSLWSEKETLFVQQLWRDHKVGNLIPALHKISAWAAPPRTASLFL